MTQGPEHLVDGVNGVFTPKNTLAWQLFIIIVNLEDFLAGKND
jgi:hypothetical protein